MLGLMEKDLRLIFARKQTLFIFFAMALIMGVSMDGAFLIGYLTMLATIVAVGTTSYDEYDNGFSFLMTLPFDRKTYVREKYLFCLIMAAAAWCFGVVLYVVGAGIRHSTVNLMGELPMLLAIIPVMHLSAAIMIPLQLRYGSEKSRVVLFIIFGITAILLTGWRKVSRGSGQSLAGLVQSLDALSPTVVLLSFTAICVLGAYASYLLSIRIMGKKEF